MITTGTNLSFVSASWTCKESSGLSALATEEAAVGAVAVWASDLSLEEAKVAE